MNAQLKGTLHFIVNLAVNGPIFGVVPDAYKPWALLIFNLAQVILAFIDPTYTIAKLGLSKKEYLGRIADK